MKTRFDPWYILVWLQIAAFVYILSTSGCQTTKPTPLPPDDTAMLQTAAALAVYNAVQTDIATRPYFESLAKSLETSDALPDGPGRAAIEPTMAAYRLAPSRKALDAIVAGIHNALKY